MPAILDHLWQSTLLALGVGLLAAAAFRKAPAGVRHGLWLAASLKFLIPFAALAALGRLLAPAGLFPLRVAPEAKLIETAAQPLARFPFVHPAALHAPLSPSGLPQVPLAPASAPAPAFDPGVFLLAVWAIGALAVVAAWAARWAGVRRIVRGARPIAWPAPMPVLASSSLMQPGLIGVLRPVLVVPETLPGRLTRTEIDAIVAHEITHLRRRDNLTAAIHMLVEALFWFHPLVWWIGARLIAERERACDEAVLKAGHDRAAYARSLVESSRLYLQAPLSCVAAASGSDLKARVEMIMTAPPTSPLSPLKKALLLAVGTSAIASPVAAGMLRPLEGRAVFARVATLTARPAPARVAAPPADGPADPAPPSRAEAAGRAPLLPVAVVDDMAAPADAAPEPALTVVALAEARPAEVAAPASSTVVPPVTVRPPADQKTIEQQTFRFVQKYAGAANPELDQIARWRDPVCVQVVGLADGQAAQVKARIEAVAKEVGLPAARADCRANVEIVFTPEPQRLMDAVARRREELLGYYHRHDGARLKTVTRPIQAWYVTATLGSSAHPTNFPWSLEIVDDPENGAPTGCGDAHVFTACLQSLLKNVLVVADAKALAGKDGGLVADYLAMLTLAQPKSLDGCGALPSVIDALARSSCAGREAPDGLTPSDAAYLTALYQADPEARKWVQQGDIAGRMAKILASANTIPR